MASNINAANPINTSPTVASVRANFAVAKTEIEALQRDYTIVETVGRALTINDANKTILYNSPSNGTFTIPTDAVLSITGTAEIAFKILQLSVGAVSIVGAAGVTNNKPADIPPAIAFGTEVATRYGVNTYAGTRV